MIKFLLAIVLLVAGIKLMASSSAFVYKYDFAKYAEQEEEGKQEVKEHGKGKYDTEDKINFHFVSSTATGSFPVGSLKICSQQDMYIQFVDSPATPPPDMV